MININKISLRCLFLNRYFKQTNLILPIKYQTLDTFNKSF